jgi:hypothetical protein
MNLVSDMGDHCAAGHWTDSLYHKVASHWTLAGADELVSANNKELICEVDDLVVSGQQRPGIWVEWCQQQTAPFDAAEFYAKGLVASVHGGYITIKIEGAGVRTLIRGNDANRHGPLLVEAPFEFRKLFPSGQLPADGEDGWTPAGNGGYFKLSAAVVLTDFDGTLYLGEFAALNNSIFLSLAGAVECAKDTLTEYSDPEQQ